MVTGIGEIGRVGRVAVNAGTRTRRWAGAVVVAAGGLLVASSFLVWFRMPDGNGGWGTLNGWGGVGGGSEAAGTNLNDAIAGYASYRPGLTALILGVVAGIVGLCLLAVPGRPPRPHRITAVVVALLGVAGCGWGLWRLIAPDSLGIAEPDEARAGLGPWLTGLAGLILLGVAGLVLAGRIDPPVPLRSRGIQPR